MGKQSLIMVLCLIMLNCCIESPHTLIWGEEEKDDTLSANLQIKKIGPSSGIFIQIFRDSMTLSVYSELDSIHYSQVLTLNQRNQITKIYKKDSKEEKDIKKYIETITPFELIEFNDNKCQNTINISYKLRFPNSVINKNEFKKITYRYSGSLGSFVIDINGDSIMFNPDLLRSIRRGLSITENDTIYLLMKHIHLNNSLYYERFIYPDDYLELSVDGVNIYKSNSLIWACPQNDLCKYLNTLILEAYTSDLKYLQKKSAISELNEICKH